MATTNNTAMYSVVGTNNPEYLLADPIGADVVAISMEPGNGTVKRGTVVYRKSTGMCAPAAEANVVNTNQLYVLDEQVDTDADPEIAEDAKAYRAGKLIYGRVTLANDAELTEAAVTVLRGQGIVFNQMDTAAEFNNKISQEVK